MIRRATADDVSRIVELGAEFLAYSPHRVHPLDREAFAAFAEQLVTGAGAIFLSDDGMIGGLVTGLYFNPAIRVGTELFWWARKEGRQLREAFEEWAKGEGAVEIHFTGLLDERADTITKVFRRAGYVPLELGFVKRF